jgi:methionyl-tRNA formyltransferase
MELVFLGVNDVGMRIYEWLCDRDGIEVSALVTTESQLQLVRELEPEIVVSVGYDHLVPPDILSEPPAGCINLHPAYLPYNRGKSPNVWSIVENTPAGVTLHYMDEEFDTGEIIARREVDLSFSDTGKDLHHRLETAQFDLFTDVWPTIEAGDVETTTQSLENGEYHSVEDFQELCEIAPDEEYSAKELLDILRALTFPPFDNAYIEIEGERYYVDVDIAPAGSTGADDPEGFLTSY